VLTSLSLHQFRCHPALTLEGLGRCVALLGSNGRGKTSILEAIYVLSQVRSFRSSFLKEIPTQGLQGFGVKATFSDEPMQKLRLTWTPTARKLSVDHLENAALREYWGKCLTVIFKNDDEALVNGAAAERRSWADAVLSALEPDLLEQLQKARNLVREKSALLKQPSPDRAVWEALTTQLDGVSDRITQARIQFTEHLAKSLQENYGRISAGAETLECHYHAHYPKMAELSRDALWDREKRFGTTLRGLHRDEWLLHLNEKAVRVYGSEGQRKAVALAMRFAELRLIADRTGRKPIVLLDDVFHQLDPERQARFWELLDPESQVFMATTRTDSFAGQFGFDSYQVGPGTARQL
jgi:DNA replication and repair protein RecF